MGKIRDFFARRPEPVEKQTVPADDAQASWSYNGGYNRTSRLLDASKFSGSTIYPSKFDLDYSALRLSARLAYWDSTQARAIIARLVDNVIGTGLTLQAAPDWKIIKHAAYQDEDAQHEAAENIEHLFGLWAASREIDAAGRLNFYETQRFGFTNELKDGEFAGVLRYSADASRMSPVSIQHIDVEQIQTPFGKGEIEAAKARGNRIVDGVEVNGNGEEIAIHVYDEVKRESTRVPCRSPNGRRFVLHPIISDIVGAVRGTPELGPLIHELQKLTDYTVAEIEAAVVNAVIAAFTETDKGAEKGDIFKGVSARGSTGNQNGLRPNDPEPGITFDKPGIYVRNLNPGQKISSFDTKRPNVNFEAFVKAIMKSLAASKSIPVEVLEMSFSANYSASRAALILFWKVVRIWRDHFAAQFLAPIYEAWFVEAVKAGRIDAPGFNESDPYIRAAWLNASWIGDSLPSIDPVKDADEDDLRLAQGATTGAAVALKYNGSDFRDNVARQKKENELKKDAGVGQVEPPAQFPGAKPKQDDETDGGDK